jgi:hypothetical protein
METQELPQGVRILDMSPDLNDATPPPTVTASRSKVRLAFWAVILGVLAVVLAWQGPASFAYWTYFPHEGDVLFQALPHQEVVDAIEGATDSDFSHCGIVAKVDGQWVVYEALGQVRTTPLYDFLLRGRERGFAVYRWKMNEREHVPAILEHARALLGLPYDTRYKMDDERIYCSELIYKAYRDATGGGQAGKLVRLGDLKWGKYEKTIIELEGGPPPLDREMITPRDLALAPQLELSKSFRIRVP